MKERERGIQRQEERCSDSHREQLAQVKTEKHREVEILTQKDRQVKMKK